MTAAATIGDFSMGRVVTRTFSSVGANLAMFVILGLLFVAAPTTLVAWLEQTLAVRPTGGVDIGASLVSSMGGLILSLVQLALSATAQAAVTFGVVSHLSGRPVSLGEAMAKGLAHWWPLVLISICVGFMGGLAALALIVPGIMLFIRWSVAVPVQIIENKGVFESMGRSAVLTSGRRWSIFGLALIVYIIMFLIEAALIAVIARPVGGMFAALLSPLTRLIVTPLISLFTVPLFAAGLASLYYELRSTREGVGVEALASVFD